MAESVLIRARYVDFGAFERGLAALKEADFRDYEAYGPVNLEELDHLMPRRGSIVRGIATAGAFFGLGSFFYMCVKTSLIYNLITGGKPPVSRLPFVIISYEGTILIGALAAFFSALALARLSGRRPPPEYDPRLSGDTFGIYVRTDRAGRARAVRLLEESGATEIDES